MALFGLFGRRRHERAGFALYTAAVAAARNPYFYDELDVPDTVDGRFDLVGLHVALLIRRLRALPPPGPAVAQAVFDAMFSDMDINLRETGLGDMKLARTVRAMWEAFHGRAAAYESALDSPDPAAMEAALVRNIWRGTPSPGAPALAAATHAAAAGLNAAAPASLLAGQVRFPAPQPA